MTIGRESGGHRLHPRAVDLVPWLDLAAVTLFAFEGAVLAADADYDIFGVLVVAVASALAGGTLRDLLIGDIPPASVRDQRYLWAAVVGGVGAFALHAWVPAIPSWLLTGLDAGGLALFAVTGAAKALERDLVAVICALIGTLTAVGGGVVRDLLLDRAPVVLRADVYATAALLGALVVVVGCRRGLPLNRMMVIGAAACFSLRVVAAWQGWNLPTAG